MTNDPRKKKMILLAIIVALIPIGWMIFQAFWLTNG